jgi:diguanylate cyclase (GGDEF)-like protein
MEAHFSQADFELVKLFAGQASIALRNAEAHQAMTVRADTDALTGLGNHGAFQRALSHALGQPEGTQPQRRRTETAAPEQPVALLMMDLDSFKAYNDRLGHPAGDALLHAIGTAIYASARSDDHVFRYGGDEFAMVLPGVELDGAMVVAERVRDAVCRLTVGEPTPVTIAVGVAVHPHDAVHKNDLIAAADTALYYGKQAGGDRVVRSTDVPRDIRDLRGTLDRLARAALLHPEDPARVDSLVQAARRSAATPAEETVRDALLAVARSLDAMDAATLGHGERVGRLAHRVADAMDLPADDVATIELAARLHGLESVGANELDAIPSLRGVGQLMRANHPDASAAGALPLGAQIIAAANAYDMLLTGAGGQRHGRRETLDELRYAAHPDISNAVIEALARVVGVPDRTPARRRHDDPAVAESGAA